MEVKLSMLFILCPLIFLASFVDAVAGGGGVISLPAYLLAGLPAHYAMGSNKLSAFCGTVVATGNYVKSGKINYKSALWSAAGAVLGSLIGSNIVLYIPEGILKGIMIAVLPIIAVILVIKKDSFSKPRKVNYSDKVAIVISTGIGIGMGIYDGMVGPGTGTFMILLFTTFLGYDLLTAGGCSKLSNLMSNFSSLIVFLIHGKVVFALAIPAAVAGILGGYAGAKFAIRGGSKNIRYCMFAVLGLMFIKFGTDLIP